ncbi:DUF3298 and DUF4163 domain-containing protein [Kushneria marisflavi]|nr:DUF3298 and DUF4163 domain-containing protein [Kushneria marisflavi]RKD84402.1 uncharacterized protein DUF3298 [Kushneria marisflavi]
MIDPTRYRWLAVPALLLTLAACDQAKNDPHADSQTSTQDSGSSTTEATGAQDPQGQQNQDQQKGLSPTFVDRTITDPNCQGDQCASVEVRMVQFDSDPALSSDIERRLIRMGSPISDSVVPEDALPTTVEAYADNFFDQSAQANQDSDNPRPYSSTLEAKEISRHDDLLVLELQSYVMTGGAHGMPGTHYMVIDERTHQVVTLDDMLKEGQQPAFEAALKNAWQDWQNNSDAGRTLDPLNWPFSSSDNAAPLEDSMAVTYDAYTLGPYAIGQPTLTIPYSALSDILKPRFIPATDTPSAQSAH